MSSESDQQSDTETADYSSTKPYDPSDQSPQNTHPFDDSCSEWELDHIESTDLRLNTDEGRVERRYELKFTGYSDTEWQPEDNVGALELVRCFWENRDKPWPVCLEAQQRLKEELDNQPDSGGAEPPGPSNPSQNLPRRPRKRRRSRRTTRDPDLASSSSGSDADDEEPESEAESQFEPDPALAEALGMPYEDLLTYKPQDPTIQIELKRLKAELFQLPRVPVPRRAPVNQGPPPEEASTSSAGPRIPGSAQSKTLPIRRLVVKPLRPQQPPEKRPRRTPESDKDLIDGPKGPPTTWRSKKTESKTDGDPRRRLRRTTHRNSLATHSVADIPVATHTSPTVSASSAETSASGGKALAVRSTTPGNNIVASPVADITVPTQISPTVSPSSVGTNESGVQAPALPAAAQPQEQQAVSDDIPVPKLL